MTLVRLTDGPTALLVLLGLSRTQLTRNVAVSKAALLVWRLDFGDELECNYTCHIQITVTTMPEKFCQILTETPQQLVRTYCCLQKSCCKLLYYSLFQGACVGSTITLILHCNEMATDPSASARMITFNVTIHELMDSPSYVSLIW